MVDGEWRFALAVGFPVSAKRRLRQRVASRREEKRGFSAPSKRIKTVAGK
jgi:hypothetical protein